VDKETRTKPKKAAASSEDEDTEPELEVRKPRTRGGTDEKLPMLSSSCALLSFLLLPIRRLRYPFFTGADDVPDLSIKAVSGVSRELVLLVAKRHRVPSLATLRLTSSKG